MFALGVGVRIWRGEVGGDVRVWLCARKDCDLMGRVVESRSGFLL